MFCMQVDVEHKTVGKWWEAKNEFDKSLYRCKTRS